MEFIGEKPFLPVANSEVSSPVKLKSAECLTQIKAQMCKLFLGDQSCVGVLTADKVIAVPQLPIADYTERQRLANESDEVGVTFKGEEYTASICESKEPMEGSLTSCAFLKINDLDFPELNRSRFYLDPLVVGQKVYFASSLENQQELSLQKGRISRLDSDEKGSFLITSDSLPKGSGEPVFIQKEGQLFLAGMLTGQSVSEEAPEFLSSSAGMVLSINHIEQVMLNIFDFSPARGAVSGKVRKNEYEVEYRESRDGKGLNRGMTIRLKRGKEPLDFRSYRLKHNQGGLLSNVHVSSVYNKNQQEFYATAAEAFLESFEASGGNIPNDFTFSLKKDEFVADIS